MPCTRHHSQYVYSASTYAISADFERPKKHSLPPQAAAVLSAHGGHGTLRAEGQKIDGLISFREAYSEVGGSFDDCHDTYTTHAWSVVEGVNVADMLTADRVVSRMAIYYPAHGKEEPSFDITGSYFENLRIAGRKVDIQLATGDLHANDKYKTLADTYQKAAADHLLLGHGLRKLNTNQLQALEEQYHALRGMSQLVSEWNNTAQPRPVDRGHYRLSAANCQEIEAAFTGTEIQTFGSIICIPKFGVVRLGEMVVHKHARTLVMFQVQMCSSGHGTSGGPTTGGSGGTSGP